MGVLCCEVVFADGLLCVSLLLLLCTYLFELPAFGGLRSAPKVQ